MNDNEVLDEVLEVEVTPTPTPAPVVVSVDNMPDFGYLSNALTGQAEQLTAIQEQVDTLNDNTGLLFGVEYFLFIVVLFEVLRFVKGLRKKED